MFLACTVITATAIIFLPLTYNFTNSANVPNSIRFCRSVAFGVCLAIELLDGCWLGNIYASGIGRIHDGTRGNSSTTDLFLSFLILGVLILVGLVLFIVWLASIVMIIVQILILTFGKGRQPQVKGVVVG